MSLVKANSLANLSSSLISLRLDDCSLQGEFPNDIFHLPFLQELRLSGNEDLFGRLPKSNWSSPLKFLDLSLTHFSGILYDTIGNLIYLNELDLSRCQFIGSLPTSLWNLTGITFLNLGSNNFSGQVSGLLSNLGQLNHLDLSMNRFSGEFPDVFGNLSKLVVGHALANNFTGYLPPSAFSHIQLSDLDLSENQFEGHIPQVRHLLDLTDKISSLGRLNLSNNKLSGPVSNSIFEHVNLTDLNLSSNKLSGIVKLEKFSKFKNLIYADLSYNDLLSLKSDMVDFILPKLVYFGFSSCNLTEFPIFLRNMKSLLNLDLSNNSIVGQVSVQEHIDCKNLLYLELSSNFLTSVEHISLMTNLQFLNLQSNLLKGSLMILPPYMGFTGTIPQCLENYDMLEFLDLRTNNFHGHIPSFLDVPIEYLNLNGNRLNGSLPTSLVNCNELEVLDVGTNMINDTFPHWLGSLPKLQVVVLKSNKFHGPIEYSTRRFPFTKLQILDLSHNQFTGLLPIRYFEKSEAMMRGDKGSPEVEYLRGYPMEYLGKTTSEYYSIVLVVKGVTTEIERILSILAAMDLLNNQFRGSIPEIVGKFNSVELLNFSNNNLIGHIPSSLGNLTKLESLDLSSNRLVGEIPKQLASLTSLAVLNLSYNLLAGPIPKGSQFNTFSNDSYIGNLGLCGFPMSKECSSDKPTKPPSTIFPEDDNDPGWFDWKIAMMGYGSGLVIGLSMGYIVFTTRKPEWLIRMVERDGPTNVRSLNRRRQGRRSPYVQDAKKCLHLITR
ncbi:receptor-like protein 34 [Pistacia vera]|uniref:receptor-like protein 34 n=1 Tax=Pistacia vera TaxID=55513 RepID=UPI001263995E|nr:receptor-like protein 34 [Pistacia vera]